MGMVHLAWKHLENIPDFGWEAAAASLKGGPGPALISGALKARAALLKAHEPGTASAGRVRPLAGLVKAGDLLIEVLMEPMMNCRRVQNPSEAGLVVWYHLRKRTIFRRSGYE